MASTSLPQPPTDSREARGLRLAELHFEEIHPVSPGVWSVPSCSGENTYLLRLRHGSCSCPDARRHPKLSCKHVLAVALCFAKRRGPRQLRYSETVEAAISRAAESYRRDLARISPAAWDAYHRDLEGEADELGGV